MKVSHNHKKHMQIFHINNSQLSTGAPVPCLRFQLVAVCLALVKGTKPQVQVFSFGLVLA